MKRLQWMTPLAGATLSGLIAVGAVSAQTDAPQQPVASPGAAAAPEEPAAAAPAGDQPAAAAPAPEKAKPRKKMPVTTLAVTVVNSRSAKLVALEAGLAGSDKMRKIAGPVVAGAKAAAHVPRGKDCLIDLHGTFDDGQTMDAAGVDACAQKILNLTE